LLEEIGRRENLGIKVATNTALILRCERSEPRRMAANTELAAILRDGRYAAFSG